MKSRFVHGCNHTWRYLKRNHKTHSTSKRKVVLTLRDVHPKMLILSEITAGVTIWNVIVKWHHTACSHIKTLPGIAWLPSRAAEWAFKLHPGSGTNTIQMSPPFSVALALEARRRMGSEPEGVLPERKCRYGSTVWMPWETAGAGNYQIQ